VNGAFPPFVADNIKAVFKNSLPALKIHSLRWFTRMIDLQIAGNEFWNTAYETNDLQTFIQVFLATGD